MKIQANKFQSIEQMSDQLRQVQSKTSSENQASALSKPQSFSKILEKETANRAKELKFSKHASQRMASRNIDLTGEQKERLEHAVFQAGQKGIQESLVMVDNLAFIVNVPNHTVITAVNDIDDAVFTNIDGAVIS